MPITPAPTTTIERGTRSRSRMLSESMMVAPSNSTVAGRAGLVPVAMTMFSALISRSCAGDLAQGDGVVVDEPAGAGEQGDVVAGQLVADDVDLAADHVLGAGGQVGDGDVLLDPVTLPVQLALGEAGEIEHRLAQRLGGDGAGVDADPADHVAAVDDGHPAAELGRGDGGLLAAGTGSDDEHVEVGHPPQSGRAGAVGKGRGRLRQQLLDRAGPLLGELAPRPFEGARSHVASRGEDHVLRGDLGAGAGVEQLVRGGAVVRGGSGGAGL